MAVVVEVAQHGSIREYGADRRTCIEGAQGERRGAGVFGDGREKLMDRP